MSSEFKAAILGVVIAISLIGFGVYIGGGHCQCSLEDTHNHQNDQQSKPKKPTGVVAPVGAVAP